ncbi:MAG: recombinase family protein [Stellaceae bacterium]
MTGTFGRERAPERACLTASDWPARDRTLWQAAIETGDLLEPGGERQRYAAVSNRKVERGYGRWITYLASVGQLDGNETPGDRITRERVVAYVKALEKFGNGTQTILARLQELYEATLVMDPLREWQWIRRFASIVPARHVPARDKRAKMIGDEELVELGLALMNAAAAQSTDQRRALSFRDGLLIALLALRPAMRRRNIAALDIDRHLCQCWGGWVVAFAEDETKTGVALEFPWPEVLVPALDRWLGHWRPILLGLKGRWTRPAGNALWISSHGSPMTQQAIYDRIVERTHLALGKNINPHLFRDCAATTLAYADPKHGPEGRPWRDTTIRGQAERGTGILNNSLYAGHLEWNRYSYIKDPRTGKRVARPNSRDKWEIVDVPHLRIIDDELWERVKARQQRVRFEIGRDEHGNALNRAHRRRFLLSGLLICGSCGGVYTIIGLDRYGCATRRSKGICSNTFAIGREEIEQRVLAGLKERMMMPELFAVFVDEFNADLRRLASDVEAERSATQRALADADRKIGGIVKAIEDGASNSSLKERLTALEKEKTAAAVRLVTAKPRPVLRLHPNLPALYKNKGQKLATALNDPGTTAEAGEIIRGLIEEIVLTPTDCILKAELYGDLARLMTFAEAQEHETNNAGSPREPALLSVVAGACNQFYLLFAVQGLRPMAASDSCRVA